MFRTLLPLSLAILAGLPAAGRADDCPLAAPPTALARGLIALEAGPPLSVEIARTEGQRRRGLMCRVRLAAGSGLLLSYPVAGERRIWMKNMRIPLDILFLDDAGRVVSLVERVPPCRRAPCPIYPSRGNARYALELNAGDVARLGLGVGRRLRLPAPDEAAGSPPPLGRSAFN